MVIDRWNDTEASQFTTPLAQRVYTSRLLGKDSELVMHGGGNTSLKSEISDILGETQAVLYIKGSGWDLATIEEKGFPAVRMDHLLKLRKLSNIGDEAMMNELRTHLLDSRSPDPSVETLLHAFLPHRVIDHTHAEAVLTLTNQPNGEALIRDLYGQRVGIVPYVMPGFQLAKLCAEVWEKNQSVEGLVLLKHGIFTFGENAKESYQRMIRLVKQAEEFIATKAKPRAPVFLSTPSPDLSAFWTQAVRKIFLANQMQGVCLLNKSSAALEFSQNEALKSASLRGPLTPDHVIRTKQRPCWLTESVVSSRDANGLQQTLTTYAQQYEQYFASQCRRVEDDKTRLDLLPRIFVVPGVGVISFGLTSKDARIAMDIYEHTISAITAAESIGRYEALDDNDIFEMEYWILEQNKLKVGSKSLPLKGKVAAVTGGASGIGLAIAKEFVTQGAEVAVLDINSAVFPEIERVLKDAAKGGNRALFLKADVTRPAENQNAVHSVIEAFGGIDILVVNAGIFPKSAPLENITLEDWSRTIEVNITGTWNVLSSALPWMKTQEAGGDILLIASKNVPAPGKQAAAYSMSKAAQVQLARVCALETAAHKIRVNTLHPHLVFDTGVWTPEILQSRAKAYGMSVEDYKTNNLLKTQILSADVAKSAFALVAGYFTKTTGAQIPVDGGSDRTL